MYVKYGSYAHQPGQDSITYTRERIYSPWRGYRYADKVTMTAQGELGRHPTKTLSQEITDFIAAYETNGYTFGLYTDAGVATQHIIDSTDSALVDLHVKVHKWPKGDRGEYACQRSYFVEVEGLFTNYDADDPWPGILRYQESMRYVGDGGPWIKWSYDQDSEEWEQTIIPVSPVMLWHTGVSVGWQGYVLPLPCANPGRVLHRQIQDSYGDITFAPNGTKEYNYTWSYPMSLTPAEHKFYTPVSR